MKKLWSFVFRFSFFVFWVLRITKNEKRKTSVAFLLFTSCFSLFTFSFALPLQEPVVGSYTCFASKTNMFDVNAKDIGASLEFVDAQTYRFTTASATEEGTVSSSVFDSDATFDTLWQSGSALILQPSSGSASYAGAFLTDKLGHSYVIVQNNNGLNIRCQSEGADIAATFEQGTSEEQGETASVEDETPPSPLAEPTATTTSSETLTPLQAVQVGAYGCFSTYETTYWSSSDHPSYYEDDDPDIFSLFLFADGTTVALGAKDKFSSQYQKGTYSFDAARGKVTFQGGKLSGLAIAYGTDAEGKATLSFIETWIEDPEGTDVENVVTYLCEYMQDLPPDLGFGLADSTPTVDLFNVTVAASKYDPNINPDVEPTQDTYYCYPSFGELETGEGLPRFVREYTLEILPNNQYTFNGEQGTFATGVDEYYLQWQSGPLNPTKNIIKTEDDYSPPHSANVAFDTWGSEINYVEVPQDDSYFRLDCFQQGAREQKALLDFAIKQPTPATYTCLPSGDNPQPGSLELLPNNRYTFNGEEGSYRAEVGEYSSDILWESGPLANSDTGYSADDSTGLREIAFSLTERYFFGLSGSSTEQTMACQMVAQANLIPKYASTTATPPPAGTGGLDGFYAKADYDQGDLINGEPPVTTWHYYHFLANGYVYQDGYITGDECNKTYPNGLPVCKGYSFSNNKITFSDGTAIGVTQADGGDILLDGVLYENKTLSGPQTLNGTYEYVLAIAAPMYMNIAGMGTNSMSTSTYTFSGDTTYSFSSSSWSQTSVPDFTPGATYGDTGALASNSSSDGDSGTYTIDGNIITFKSAQGFTTQCGFFFPVKGDTTRVNICGTDYDPPSKE